MTLFYRFFRSLARTFFGLMGGFDVRHAERLPASGPAIIAANHASFADPPAAGVAAKRPLHFMAQAELFRPPIFRSIIRKLGAFPIHRGESDLAAVKKALEVLGQGGALVMFPEGTRGDGKRLGSPQKGMNLIAAKSDAPIVPTAITGTFKLLPKGAKLPRRAKVCVIFGEPIRYSEVVAEFGREQAKVELSRIIMERIQRLLAEAGENYSLTNGGAS